MVPPKLTLLPLGFGGITEEEQMFYYRDIRDLAMRVETYLQPESCQIGQEYYLQVKRDPGRAGYQKVRFLAYRPHPAEVLVHDGQRARVVHRRFLFSKAPSNGRPS